MDPNNYRPISILCSFAKVFEKLIFNQLSQYLKNNNNNILSPVQSGLRPNHSTTTALSKFTYAFSASDTCKLTFLLISRRLLIWLTSTYSWINFMQLVYHKMNYYGLTLTYIKEIIVWSFKGVSLTFLSNKKVYPRVQCWVHYSFPFLLMIFL